MLFTELEKHKEVLETPNKKSSGPHSLTYEALESTTHSTAPLLKKLFNDILSNGKIPDVWMSSYQLPLYKGKGTLKDPHLIIEILRCSRVFTRFSQA